MSDIVLSVPVDAGGVDPLLASLEKINQNLNEINSNSKGAMDAFSKSLDKSNKKLKETDKTFGEIFKKIKLSGLMKMGAGVIGAGAGIVGLSTGALLFGALRNAGGTVGTRYAGAGLGMSSAEMKALQTASKLTTGKEETLVNAMANLSNTLTSGTGSGALATLGLNQEQLRAMSPEKALEAVFNAVKGKGTGIGSEYIRTAFGEITGLSGQDYNVATKQGAGFARDYADFLAKYASVDFDALGRGADSLIKFQTQLDITSQKIGGKLADPLANILTKLTPYLEQFADGFGKLLDSITQEDIDNFVSSVGKLFDFIGGVAKGIDEASQPGASQEYYNTRNAQLKAGNIPGAIVSDVQGFTSDALAGIRNNLAFIFNPEARMQQMLAQKEPFLREMLKTKGQQFNPEQWSWLEQLGYISGGQLTQKANALKVEIVVKDPSGKVLSSGIVTQPTGSTTNPIRGR